MGIDKIREAVLSDAKKEAKNIIELAIKNSNALLEKKKNEIDEEFERIYKTQIQEISDEFTRKLIQFKGATNKKILEKRNILIDKIIKRAKEKVLNLPKEKYMELMAQLIKKTSFNTAGMIQVHKDEKELFSELVERLNKERDQSIRLTLDETCFLSDRGGFVFVTKDYEVNQTLDILLNDIKKEILPIIAKELFKNSFER